MEKDVLKKIEKEISDLTPEELLKLVELAIEKLKKHQMLVKEQLDWREIYGIGKGLWKNDAQTYVKSLRKESI